MLLKQNRDAFIPESFDLNIYICIFAPIGLHYGVYLIKSIFKVYSKFLLFLSKTYEILFLCSSVTVIQTNCRGFTNNENIYISIISRYQKYQISIKYFNIFTKPSTI